MKRIYEFVRKEVGSEYPLILGAGSNSTEKTIEWTKEAGDWGADGVLLVTPYYNKPTQEGLFQHFSKVAESCSLPFLLYNVPSRTITSMELETLTRLSKMDSIVGIKEATGEMSFGKKLIEQIPNWLVTSGDDGSYLELMLHGGRGVISVLSHVIPRWTVELALRAMEGDDAVIKESQKLQPLLEALYIESNPIPVKMALYKMGVIASPELRLPMTVATEATTEKLTLALKELGII